MKVTDQKAWDDWKAKNTDPYSACVFRYAEKWADMMEAAIAGGSPLEEIAKDKSHEADTEGVTCR